jgi:chromosome partitioning protein
MRTIAFVTHRGGAGKSTLAASLAVAARETLESVAVVDMDPQGSLIEWARARGSSDVEAIATGAARLEATLVKLSASGHTLAIVDTPGAEGPASSAAIAAAGLAIVPTRPSLFDLRASADMRAALKAAGGDFGFLLNLCTPDRNSAQVRDAAEALEEMGGLIAPPIFARTDYPNAARRGRGVTEFNPHGAAAEEMRVLWASIRRRLPDARPGSRARRAA